jgi:hypothetical protein
MNDAGMQSKGTLVKSTVAALRSTLQSAGLKGLYRGFFVHTIGGLPSQG